MSSIQALLSGDAVEGVWIDRAEQSGAGERGEPNPDSRFTSWLRLEVSPLPYCDELTPEQCQARIRAMAREIEADMECVAVFGKQAICNQNPHDRPTSNSRRTAAPRFHALQRQVRRALEVGYHLFRRTYRQAFEDWRVGKPHEFLAACFAPGRFVPLRT